MNLEWVTHLLILENHCPADLSALMEMLSVLHNMKAAGHMWRLSLGNVASVTEQLDFSF